MYARQLTGCISILLDGGGIRGLSELLILKEILYQVQYKEPDDDDDEDPQPLRPCEYFDVIGGSGTGG